MTTLHRTLEAQRPHPVAVIRPPVLATLTYLFLLFVGWVALVVTSPARDVLALDGNLLLGLRVLAAALIVWVGWDAWRARRTLGVVGALVVATVAVTTLGGVFVLLTWMAGGVG